MAFFSRVKNKVGLPKPQLKLLLELFRNLKDLGNNLHDRLLRYVLDGVEDDGALAELTAKTDAGDALNLRCSHQYVARLSEISWGAFFRHVEPVDFRCYLRLGKVFAADATGVPADRFFCDAWFDGARWLEILLQEATRMSARVWSSEECRTAISGQHVEEMLQADGRQADFFVMAPFRADERDWEYSQIRNNGAFRCRPGQHLCQTRAGAGTRNLPELQRKRPARRKSAGRPVIALVPPHGRPLRGHDGRPERRSPGRRPAG